jgi:putative effector of murein hydrolase LrgA (UPF0299 family)
MGFGVRGVEREGRRDVTDAGRRPLSLPRLNAVPAAAAGWRRPRRTCHNPSGATQLSRQMLFYLTLLLCCQLVGELFVVATDLPIPGPVIGMALLFAGLLVSGRIPDGLATFADALLGNLSLLFVPAGVGIIVHFALIGTDALAISVALVVSTLLTIAVTAWCMLFFTRRERRKRDAD